MADDKEVHYVDVMAISDVIRILQAIQSETGEIGVMTVTTPEGLPHDSMDFRGVVNVVLTHDTVIDKKIAVMVAKEGNKLVTGKLRGVKTAI